MVTSADRAGRSRSQGPERRSVNDRAGGTPLRDGAVRGDHGRFAGPVPGAGPHDGPVRSHDVLAALDLGTNNCRLLVARPQHHRRSFRVIDAFSRIVRLGEGMGRTGYLSDDAITRTLDALRVCSSKMRRRRVTRFRAVATEACRRATNRGVFLDRVEEETGIELEIISTAEEAGLAMAGCGSLLNPEVPGALVFDIGGGSTELAWSRGESDAAPTAVASIPIGVVTLAEKYGGDRYADGIYDSMVDEVATALAPYEAEHGIQREAEAGRLQVIGTSGTVTTLAGVHLDLPRYVRDRVDGVFLEVDNTLEIGRWLASLDYEARAAHPCIGRDRADLVVAGCAILEAICRQWPVPTMRVADRGVREGILFGLMAGNR